MTTQEKVRSIVAFVTTRVNVNGNTCYSYRCWVNGIYNHSSEGQAYGSGIEADLASVLYERCLIDSVEAPLWSYCRDKGIEYVYQTVYVDYKRNMF
jgi:hypothetical protein